MKPKSFLEFMGFRKKPQHYGYVEETIELDDGRSVSFAKWQHPRMAGDSVVYQFWTDHVGAYSELIKEGDLVIDIGAHCGDTTLPMSIAAGLTGRVIALEPNPYIYHVLEKNARANRHLGNITSIMAAAGPEQGFHEFEYSDSGFCNGGRHEGMSALKHGHPYKLTAFCIDLQKELQDSYADELDRLRLIKVDAEGYDLYILQSLLEIIESYRPVVKAEVFKKTSDEYRRELFDLFASRDYDVYEMAAEPLQRGDKLDREAMTKAGHFDVLCFPR